MNYQIPAHQKRHIYCAVNPNYPAAGIQRVSLYLKIAVGLWFSSNATKVKMPVTALSRPS